MSPDTKKDQATKLNIFKVLTSYRPWILLALVLILSGNALALWIPQLTAAAIDAIRLQSDQLASTLWQASTVAILVMVLLCVQSIVQNYLGERVAKDLREALAQRVSQFRFLEIQTRTSAVLLTNFTTDVEAVKVFASQAIIAMVSSVFLIVGAGSLLLWTNVKLGLAVLLVLPLIAGTFMGIFSKVSVLFARAQQLTDQLNRLISESILGAALIRVLHAETIELGKFELVNREGQQNGVKILKLFSSMVPIITLLSGLATITVLTLGGRLVMEQELSVGELAAFNGYVSLLIFPIFIIGFMSNAISRATVSYGRIQEILQAPVVETEGSVDTEIRGAISVADLSLTQGTKEVLRHLSFRILPRAKTAIIGPTAAGKTQLLNVLAGLVPPTTGVIQFDGVDLAEYRRAAFHRSVAFVFQDSVLFEGTLRENIAFRSGVSEADLSRAIQAAELESVLANLPDGLETEISERGTNLSGGQKQRVMLARALALNPRVLILDDFTARVDVKTEAKIIANLAEAYPELTLISVTQKIAPVQSYDQIILLMEGELIASGTHAQLLQTSPEYHQIVESQQSTEESYVS